MLPSEKAERWVRRVGYAALALIALYIVVWLAGFISRATRRALQQREQAAESAAGDAETDR